LLHNSVGLQDPVKLIQYIITELADDHQSKFLKELTKFCADLYKKNIGRRSQSIVHMENNVMKKLSFSSFHPLAHLAYAVQAGLA
jgi:hypothetical protein